MSLKSATEQIQSAGRVVSLEQENALLKAAAACHALSQAGSGSPKNSTSSPSNCVLWPGLKTP